ncbi:MAG TPA: hypothetical protein VGF48_02480 [Thermoanaerobaculia bacterium]|jgi:HD superfamily phosphohydrolase
MDDRLEFYDPLYETISFERGLPAGRGFHLENEDDPLDPRDIVVTAEFSRLSFLRQVGLAWLVFPSATHTRFAHSIGCWWLGRIAESAIKVMFNVNGDSRRQQVESRSLRWWLERQALREEFYLALLLHDIGHGPLSHVLEHNDAFVSALTETGMSKPDHEHRGAALLLGEGPLARAWPDIAVARYGKDTRRFDHVRKGLQKLKGKVCLSAVAFLMTGDTTYADRCSHSHRSGLSVVKELVSGVLDLDRLDHYARDSYFSGLRQVSFNLRGFLSSIRIRFIQDANQQTVLSLNERDAVFSLGDNGASYAASLLFSKRQIVFSMFRNARSVALHAMANRALTILINSAGVRSDKQKLAVSIALMDDDEFLHKIADSSEPECRSIARRIRAVRPYALALRWPNTDLGLDHASIKARLSEFVARHDGDVLVYTDQRFWDRSPADSSRDWLDTGHFLVEDTGRPLTEHPDHRGDFAHLREADKLQYLWAFVTDSSAVPVVNKKLSAILAG